MAKTVIQFRLLCIVWRAHSDARIPDCCSTYNGVKTFIKWHLVLIMNSSDSFTNLELTIYELFYEYFISHRATNFASPEFQFLQFKVLQSVFYFIFL